MFIEEPSFLPPMGLRSPTDVELANHLFDANCGPASLAAILSIQICDLMALFDQFPESPYTSRQKMEDILKEARVLFLTTSDLPAFGLALIQFEGPWSSSPSTARWAGRYSHWIGVSGDQFYEINCDRWTDRREWETNVATALVASYPSATGWRVKLGLEVVPQPFAPGEVLPGFRFGRGSISS
jgi:hypothetical protein